MNNKKPPWRTLLPHMITAAPLIKEERKKGKHPTLQSYFFQTVTFTLFPKSLKCLFLFRFSKETLYSLLYHIHVICHTQSSPSLYSYLPLKSNILLTPLLSQNLNLCSSLDIRHQISHPNKTTVTLSVL